MSGGIPIKSYQEDWGEVKLKGQTGIEREILYIK